MCCFSLSSDGSSAWLKGRSRVWDQIDLGSNPSSSKYFLAYFQIIIHNNSESQFYYV